MIGAKPPPYDDFRRYALIPTSLTKQLQAAAFQSDGADVELDMSSLVENVQGEEIFVTTIHISAKRAGTRLSLGKLYSGLG